MKKIIVFMSSIIAMCLTSCNNATSTSFTMFGAQNGNSYQLRLKNNDDTKGTITGGGVYESDSDVTITATPKKGCKFVGWHNGTYTFSIDLNYTFKMPAHNLTYEAYWAFTNYKITYDLDGGVNNPLNPSTYRIIDEVKLEAPTRKDYSFAGWTLEGKRVLKIEKGTIGDLTLVANWTNNPYQVNLKVDTTTKGQGTVSGAARYAKGDVVNVTATPSEGSVFKWWTKEGVKVSEDPNYTFVMGDRDLSLNAVFMTHKEDETWKINQGILPAENRLDLTGNSITYGLYPRYHVKNEELISDLNSIQSWTSPDKNGYYFYKNKYYVPVEYGNPYSDNYTFSTGLKIVEGKKYWFECDTITWKIVKRYSETGEYLVVSNFLIDVINLGPFTSDNKNYATSHIRSWLNNEFYNNSFYYNKENISTYTYPNEYSHTKGQTDNIFILTLNGYQSKEYGYEYKNDRKAAPSDYAKARGAYYSLKKKSGIYWSATGSGYNYKCIDNDGGTITYITPEPKILCVRPCMIINDIYVRQYS